MLIGIIGAMDIEVRALCNLMEEAEIEKISSVEFYRGRIEGVDTVVAVAGVGKVNAAVCAQTMILKYSPDCVINTGVAGGLAPELGIGDIAVAKRVAEHDMDTTPLGDAPGFITGLDTVYMDCDDNIVKLMCKAIERETGKSAVCGTIASGDQFIASDEQRKRIIKDFNAVAAEMEGAAIGHVCTMNGVKFGVLRSISDGANSGSAVDFPTFAKSAADTAVKIIRAMLRDIKENYDE